MGARASAPCQRRVTCRFSLVSAGVPPSSSAARGVSLAAAAPENVAAFLRVQPTRSDASRSSASFAFSRSAFAAAAARRTRARAVDASGRVANRTARAPSRGPRAGGIQSRIQSLIQSQARAPRRGLGSYQGAIKPSQVAAVVIAAGWNSRRRAPARRASSASRCCAACSFISSAFLSRIACRSLATSVAQGPETPLIGCNGCESDRRGSSPPWVESRQHTRDDRLVIGRAGRREVGWVE
eukprot:2866712-Prymnesium_polylepis.1